MKATVDKNGLKARSAALCDEEGSAVAEFVLLALPLFLPALLFFITLANSINSEMEASMLARQAVTAFVSGQDDVQAHSRVRILLNEYEKLNNQSIRKTIQENNINNLQNSTDERISYLVDCEANPCIAPGAKVQLTLYLEYSVEDRIDAINITATKINEDRRAIASASAYVDKWR